MRQRAGQPTRPENVADEDLKLHGAQRAHEQRPRAGDPAAREVPAGQLVAQAPGARALRAVPEQLAEGARDRDADREGRVAAGPAAARDPGLGMFGGTESRQVLSEIYASTTDASVKKAVLQAFMVAGEKDRVLEAARGEKDPGAAAPGRPAAGRDGRARRAVAMYQSETEPEAKKAVLQALGSRRRHGPHCRDGEERQGPGDAPRGACALLGPFGGPSKARRDRRDLQGRERSPGEGGGAQRPLRLEQRHGAHRHREDREGPASSRRGRSHTSRTCTPRKRPRSCSRS